MKKIIVLCSGGLDSTVLLYHCKAQGLEVTAMALDYGQLHKKELELSKWHAKQLGLDWVCLDIKQAFESISNPMFGDGKMPTGTYQEQLKDAHEHAKETVATYVPNRNMIFLSVAAGQALARGYDAVGYAAHANDATRAAYPDCSPEFAEKMNVVLTTQGVTLYAPFIGLTKAGIVYVGQGLKIDFAKTWSCYSGSDKPCGKCGTCIDRADAFKENNLPDPLIK